MIYIRYCVVEKKWTACIVANTYYGGNGISTQSPIFEYTYNGTYYREQTAQNISHKRLNRSMTQGNVYSIYIDPKHPAVFILAKKIKIGTIVSIILGLFIFTYGIDLLYPIFAYVIEPIVYTLLVNCLITLYHI